MVKLYTSNPNLNLRQVIPDQIYDNSEKFVTFIKAYYEWMHTTQITYQAVSGTFVKGEAIVGQLNNNTATISYLKSATELVVFVTGNSTFDRDEIITGQTSGATGAIKTVKDNVLRQGSQIINNRDVDKSIDIFSEYLKDELFANIPSSYQGDKRLLAKRIRDYYQAKGHEESYKFFMKLLYDEDIELTYPGDEVLKVSDGNFSRETIIRARVIGGDNSNRIFDFLFKTIRGRLSGAIANVVDIKKIFVGSQYLAEMKLSLVSGVFTAEEEIYDISDVSENPLETTIFGLVSGYDIAYGGSGYVAGDILTVGGDGQQATLRVTDTETSGIDSINLLETGYGYRVGSVTLADNTGTGGSGLAVVVSSIANSYNVTVNSNTYTVGEVTSVKVINKGSNYFDIPTIVLRDSVIYDAGMISEKNITIVDKGQYFKPGETVRLNFGNYTVQANAEVGSVEEPPDPPSTNYLLFSDQFETWTANNIYAFGANSVIDTTATLDPFGGNDAEYIREKYDGLTVRRYLEKQVSFDTPGYNTFSVYLKNVPGLVSGRNAVIHISNNPNANSGDIIGATIDFANNAIASANLGANSLVTNTSIDLLPNDWKRVSISGKCDSANTTLYARVFLHSTSAASNTYVGSEYLNIGVGPVLSGALYVSHGQFEPGNVATAHIASTANVGIRLGGDFNIYLEDGDGTVNKLMLESDDYVKYNTTNTVCAEWFGNGPIARIKMRNRGQGYTLANLNLITFDFPDTASGFGANLEINGIMGTGANVVVDVANNSSGIGSIKRIIPVNFGVDYSTANVNTVGVGNGDANIVPIIAGSGTTAGAYVGDSGKIDYKKLQDSYYYQQYSYVIKSGLEISKYKEVLKRLLHPAGLEVFGEISIRNNLNMRLKSDDPIKIQNVLKVLIVLLSIPADDLVVSKVADFIGEGDTAFAEVEIGLVENVQIQVYKYYTFTSIFGIAVYFEIEKETKLEGTVDVDSATRIITGSGTQFLEHFSVGDDFVVVDRLGSTGANKFNVEELYSDTSMKVFKAHSTNIVGAEVYLLSL